MPCQCCLDHLPNNVYHSTSSFDLFIMSLTSSSSLLSSTMSTSTHLFLISLFHNDSGSSLSFFPILCPYYLSVMLPSFLQCLPPQICIVYHSTSSLHSTMILTISLSYLLITCPYHLSLASLVYSVMSTILYLLRDLFIL
jgi:hypothetical protein